MSAIKIMVVTTIESTDIKATLFDSLNVKSDRFLLEMCYSELGDIKEVLAQGKGFEEQIKQYSSTEIGKQISARWNAELYKPFIDKFNACAFHGDRVVAPVNHMNAKPDGFDFIVGYIVPKDRYDIDHMQRCENISEEYINKLCEAHNKLLRKMNDDGVFDLFIDGEDLESAVLKIKALGNGN